MKKALKYKKRIYNVVSVVCNIMSVDGMGNYGRIYNVVSVVCNKCMKKALKSTVTI